MKIFSVLGLLTMLHATLLPAHGAGPANVAEAQQWSRFRGPNGSGVAPDADIPVSWTEKDFAWKTPVPGRGHGSPVVWGDKVFLAAGEADSGKRLVTCVSADNGQILWSRELPGVPYKMHKSNSIGTSTPAVDADRIYTAWGSPRQIMVLALDHSGKTVWEADLGPYKGGHGFGASPVVHGDLVVLNLDQDKEGALIALDKATGKVRWQVPRQSGNATYSTPCVYQPKGRPAELIFTNWKHGITAIDPATGKVNWETSVFEPEKNERSIASPVIAGDLVLGTCGFVTAQKHLVAVLPPGGEGRTAAKEVWRLERAVSYLPTPVVKGDRVYLCSEQGMATCLEASTGRVIWQERAGREFYGSPVCVGERIYCPGRSGDVVVLAASDTFRILGGGPLGEATQSSPAVAGSKMYFRTVGHLVCIGK